MNRRARLGSVCCVAATLNLLVACGDDDGAPSESDDTSDVADAGTDSVMSDESDISESDTDEQSSDVESDTDEETSDVESDLTDETDEAMSDEEMPTDDAGAPPGEDEEEDAGSTPPEDDGTQDAGADPEEPTHDAGSHGDGGVHWGYTGELGPEHWADLAEEFAICEEGNYQSPVNFPASLPPQPIDDLEFDYAATPATLMDNGHTIVVAPGDGAGPNMVLVDGVAYTLLQFHFHAESEHRVNGEAYPLELHLVHQSESGDLAVVGIFFNVGTENDTLWEVFDSMIDLMGEPALLEDPIDLSALLPEERDGWAYAGSLTTPPCSEGVRWSVYAQAQSVSEAQLAAFTDLHAGSYRPVLDNDDILAQLEADAGVP